MPTAIAAAMNRLLRGLCLLVAVKSADAQARNSPASCAAADTLLGAASAGERLAPVRQATWPDGSRFMRTGTSRPSASGLAISALQSADDPARTEIQLEFALPAARVRDILVAQDSLLLRIDTLPALSLGVPSTARIDSPIVVSLPLLAPLDFPTLLSLARARSAEVHIRGTRAHFTATDREATRRLTRLMICARPAA